MSGFNPLNLGLGDDEPSRLDPPIGEPNWETIGLGGSAPTSGNQPSAPSASSDTTSGDSMQDDAPVNESKHEANDTKDEPTSSTSSSSSTSSTIDGSTAPPPPSENVENSPAYLSLLQRVADLEHSDTMLRAKLGSAMDNAKMWESRASAASETIAILRKSLSDRPVTSDASTHEIAMLRADNAKLIELSAKQQAEIDRGTEEMERMGRTLADKTNQIHELENKLHDAESKVGYSFPTHCNHFG